MSQQPPQPPPPQHPWGQQPPPSPPRKNRTLLIVLGIIGGCLVLFAGCTALLAALAPDPDETTRLVTDAAATSTVPAATEPAATEPAPAATKPKAATIGEGTWKAGSEVKPGTYTATVPDDSINCYYARLRDFENGLDSIIANNNYSPGQRARVTIKSSDVGFETSGCGTWTRAG